MTSGLGRGLGRGLLFWFLGMALVPMALAMWLIHGQALTALNKSSEDSLHLVLDHMHRIISDRISDEVARLTYHATTDGAVEYFDTLVAMDQQLSTTTGQPQASPEALETQARKLDGLTTRYRQELLHHVETHEPGELYFMSVDGRVLFSLTHGGDEKAYSGVGSLAVSSFYERLRRLRDHGGIVFSDINQHPFASGEQTGFLTRQVISRNGDLLGLLNLGVGVSQFDRVLAASPESSLMSESFLLDVDGTVRSNLSSAFGGSALNQRIHSPLVSHWQKHLGHSVAVGHGQAPSTPPVFEYDNLHGQRVVAMYQPIDIYGVELALVTEMVRSSVVPPDFWLSGWFILGILGTLLLVLLATRVALSKTASPIMALSDWGRDLANGKLYKRNLDLPDNEIKALQDTFNVIVESLQQATEVSKSISRGDFSHEIPIRGEQDELGKALLNMTDTLRTGVNVADSVSSGDFSARVPVRSDKDRFGMALNEMIVSLQLAADQKQRDDWLARGQSELNSLLREEQSPDVLADHILSQLCAYLSIPVAVMYFADEEGPHRLHLVSSYAHTNGARITNTFDFGEGVVGQAAKEQHTIFISPVPEGYMTIASGLGEVTPRHLMVVPLILGGRVVGVMELGSIDDFGDDRQALIESVTENIGIAIERARNRESLEELLQASRKQAQELGFQREELQASNEALEIQKQEINHKKAEIELGSQQLATKARELEEASRYKSEFMANMSHELRTPLNSMLILARDLEENSHGHMDDSEIESARVIGKSGRDLLNLINDILNLSKLDAGKMEVNRHDVDLKGLLADLKAQFMPLATDKDLELSLSLDANVPSVIFTDGQKLSQILGNLLSNAIKFTARGQVSLSLHRGSRENALVFDVVDTGIGIASEQQDNVFQAFTQGDGSISRQFGGTGLGLSISREYAMLLGGNLQLESELGKGSRFSLRLNDPSLGFVQDQRDALELEFLDLPQEPSSQPYQEASREFPVELEAPERPRPASTTEVLLLGSGEGSEAATLLAARGVALRHMNWGVDSLASLAVRDFAALVVDLVSVSDSGQPPPDFSAFLHSCREYLDGFAPIVVLLSEPPAAEFEQDLAHCGCTSIVCDGDYSDRLAAEMGLLASQVKDQLANNEPPFSVPGYESEESPQANYCLESGLSGRKILVVDDDLRNTFALAKLLKKCGIEVTLADNGAMALEKLDEDPDQDLILMDLMMPVMDGYEATRQIRSQSRFVDLPILTLSAQSMPEVRKKSLEAGASDYLSKPVDVDALMEKMRPWLN